MTTTEPSPFTNWSRRKKGSVITLFFCYSLSTDHILTTHTTHVWLFIMNQQPHVFSFLEKRVWVARQNNAEKKHCSFENWSDRLIGDLQCCNCNSQDAFFSVKVDHKN